MTKIFYVIGAVAFAAALVVSGHQLMVVDALAIASDDYPDCQHFSGRCAPELIDRIWFFGLGALFALAGLLMSVGGLRDR